MYRWNMGYGRGMMIVNKKKTKKSIKKLLLESDLVDTPRRSRIK